MCQSLLESDYYCWSYRWRLGGSLYFFATLCIRTFKHLISYFIIYKFMPIVETFSQLLVALLLHNRQEIHHSRAAFTHKTRTLACCRFCSGAALLRHLYSVVDCLKSRGPTGQIRSGHMSLVWPSLEHGSVSYSVPGCLFRNGCHVIALYCVNSS